LDAGRQILQSRQSNPLQRLKPIQFPSGQGLHFNANSVSQQNCVRDRPDQGDLPIAERQWQHGNLAHTRISCRMTKTAMSAHCGLTAMRVATAIAISQDPCSRTNRG
jgi:hypothetical protein